MWLTVVFVICIETCANNSVSTFNGARVAPTTSLTENSDDSGGVSGLGVAGGGKVHLGDSAYLECISDNPMEMITMTSPEGIVYKTTRGKGITVNIRSVKMEYIGTWTCRSQSMGAYVSATINLELITGGVTGDVKTTAGAKGPATSPRVGDTASTTRARPFIIYFLCVLVIIAGIKGHKY